MLAAFSLMIHSNRLKHEGDITSLNHSDSRILKFNMGHYYFVFNIINQIQNHFIKKVITGIYETVFSHPEKTKKLECLLSL